MDPTTTPPLERHPLNRDFRWAMPPRDGLRILTSQQHAQFDELGFCRRAGVFTADEVAAVIAAIDPLERAHEGKAARGRRQAAPDRGRRHHLHRASRAALAGAARLHAASRLQGSVPRPHRRRRAPLLGPGRLQEAARSHGDSRGTRTTATRTSSRSSTSPAGSPLTDATATTAARGRARPAPPRHAAHHSSTPIGCECLERSRASAVAVPARAGGVVVFSSLTPHLTGPNTHRRGAQGLHPAVRAGRRGHASAHRRDRSAGRSARQYFVLRGGR